MKNTPTTIGLIDRASVKGFDLKVRNGVFDFWVDEEKHPIYSCRGEVMAQDFVLHIEGKQGLVI